MYYLAAANVECYMSNSAAVVVEQQVAGLQVAQGYGSSASALCCCIVRKADSEVCEDCHGESGAVSAACQAGTTVYVRVADKLCCVSCDLSTAAVAVGNSRCSLFFLIVCSVNVQITVFAVIFTVFEIFLVGVLFIVRCFDILIVVGFVIFRCVSNFVIVRCVNILFAIVS